MFWPKVCGGTIPPPKKKTVCLKNLLRCHPPKLWRRSALTAPPPLHLNLPLWQYQLPILCTNSAVFINFGVTTSLSPPPFLLRMKWRNYAKASLWLQGVKPVRTQSRFQYTINWASQSQAYVVHGSMAAARKWQKSTDCRSAKADTRSRMSQMQP